MIGAAHPALPTDAQQWVDDHDAFDPFTNDLTVYRDMVYGATLIPKAMDYDAMHVDLRSAIWDALDAIETASGVPASLSEPAEYAALDPFEYPGPFTTAIWLTRQEAIDSYSAKVAHALYQEINETFPWSIRRYSEGNMRLLLDPDQLYSQFDTEAVDPNEAAAFSNVCDHSPGHAYAIVSPEYTLAPSQVAALGNVFDNIARTFRHANVAYSDPEWIVTLDDAMVYSVGTPTLRYSRKGCHSMTPLLCAWMRSINIPAQWFDNEYYAGGGHANPTFPTAGLFLAHGDDPYNAYLSNHVGASAMVSYAYWETDIATLGPAPADAGELYDATVYPGSVLASARPSDFMKLSFANPPSQGWFYLVDGHLFEGLLRPTLIPYLGPIFSKAETDTLYHDLVYLTGETGLDKPDATNTGHDGSLDSPTSGAVTLSTPDEVWEDKDHTGTVTVTAANVTIQNCAIDGNGGAGIVVNASVEGTSILNCEITGCGSGSGAIEGMPEWVSQCHIHTNDQHGLLIGGTGYSGQTTTVEKCFVETSGQSTSGAGWLVTSGATEDVRCWFSTFDMTGTGTQTACIQTGGAMSDMDISWCWFNGGSYMVAVNDTGQDTRVHSSQFGRTAVSGLCVQLQTIGAWAYNRYEDDGSAALVGDAAPL